MRFENKVVLVTGGNFGIGRSIAHRFAREGAKVAIVARNEERANDVVRELTDQGSVAVFFKADVSSEDAVKDMIHAVLMWSLTMQDVEASIAVLNLKTRQG